MSCSSDPDAGRAAGSAPAEGGSAAAPDYPAIDDYAVIGDCRTAALVARSGTIEWLCLPDFSSPSCFAAILDRRRGGAFSLCPPTPCESSRRYLPDTAVLETTFATATGRARLLDFFAIGAGDDRSTATIRPQRELIRIVEGLEGCVDFIATIDPRPDYGRGPAVFFDRPDFGWVLPGPGSLTTFRSDFGTGLRREGGRLVARASVEAGDVRTVSLAHSRKEVAIQPAIGAVARAELDAVSAWWRAWASRCTFQGPRRPMVVRSAITLKLMTYALSGAVVAAVTMSLPEAIGAGRNWDYRFCWLRDASTTMEAFLGLGLHDEADAFMGWLLHATRLTRPELRILYDLHGRSDATETTLPHLDGYRGSRPVRIGNAAASQLQLDTYGSVIAAAYRYIGRMGPLRGGEMRLLRDFGEVICRRWREPDQGLWEVRGSPRHFTATKVMCWAGLDRLIRLHEEGTLSIPVERFRRNRDALRTEIEERGFSPDVGAYVGEFDARGGGSADAAVLLMAPMGYGDPAAGRLRGTLAWVTRELGRDGLYMRYPPGFDGDASMEGTFGICLAWAVQSMCRQGDLDAAGRALDRFERTANDVGLFAEEYDVDAGSSLGNFPQAFSHAGYVAASLAIKEGAERP